MKRLINSASSEVRLPRAGVMTNEEVLGLSVEKLCSLSLEDLKKLVDYAGHRIVETRNVEPDYTLWSEFFEKASGALYGYL